MHETFLDVAPGRTGNGHIHCETLHEQAILVERASTALLELAFMVCHFLKLKRTLSGRASRHKSKRVETEKCKLRCNGTLIVFAWAGNPHDAYRLLPID